MTTTLILLVLLHTCIATSYDGQKYVIRKLYSTKSCSGSAAVAQALELNKCFPSVDNSIISLKYSIVDDDFITTTWVGDDTCTKKSSSEQKSSISQQCQAISPNLNFISTSTFSKSSTTTTTTTTQYASFVFTNSIPDSTIGYPYLQTNYTASNVCNTSLFNVPILFHQDTTDTCLPAATLSYKLAQSIKLKKGSTIDTSFVVEYYQTNDCGDILGSFKCPSSCRNLGKGFLIPTSVSCFISTSVVAGGHGFVKFAIISLLLALVFGYLAFVYMRRRAEFDPDSISTPVGSQWMGNNNNAPNKGANSYSTF